MPEGVQNDPNAGQQRQQPNIVASVFRMVFMWWILSFIRGNKPAGPSRPLVNSFIRGELVDVSLYLTETPMITPDMFDPKSEPVLHMERIGLATHPASGLNLTLDLPEGAKQNGSLFLHAFFARHGHEMNMFDKGFDGDDVFHGVVQMNKYMPKRKHKIQKKLLEAKDDEVLKGEEAKVEEAEESWRDSGDNKTEIISYWKNLMTVAMVDDFSKYSNTSIPPHVYQMMDFQDEGHYKPMIFFNEFWVLRESMVPINETTDSVPLEVTITSITPWLVQLGQQFEQSLQLQEQWGMSDEPGKDSDGFKKILTESNPILLGVTMVVSLLHSVFEFMAFKSDIGFWKDNRSMRGLSAKSILINTACQLIVTLYLFDNETNFMVMFGQVVGLFIEFWKITKAMNVSIVWWGSLPMLSLKERTSYTEGNTKEHDDTAMRYLSYVLFPLVICYGIYTLLYEEHKSWYSWVLGSLVGAVYMFGFILMCPQLYLNYKLKSVAHLPGKQLMYKFLTTIIDDLFAFAIKMPSLHRLAVFRDDVVFLMYLYQWWIYGVDKKRVNEFGYSGEAEESSTEQSALQDSSAAGSEVVQQPEKGAQRRKVKQTSGEDVQEASQDDGDQTVESKKGQ